MADVSSPQAIYDAILAQKPIKRADAMKSYRGDDVDWTGPLSGSFSDGGSDFGYVMVGISGLGRIPISFPINDSISTSLAQVGDDTDIRVRGIIDRVALDEIRLTNATAQPSK